MSDTTDGRRPEPTAEEAQATLARETAPKEQAVIPDEERLVELPEGGLRNWAKENLFGSVKDTILTFVFGAVLVWLAIKGCATRS